MNASGSRILVVDDEPGIRRLLRSSLAAHGFSVHESATGEQALRDVPIARPAVVILDLGLPDLDGVRVIRSLREWTQVPIIVLSVRDGESDKIAALDAGADDYLTKPFGPGELLARVRVALRRATKQDTGPIFQTGDLTVNLIDREVRCRGEVVQLTPTEYDLLRVLVLRAGKVLTHRNIVRELWPATYYDDALHLLRVNVSNLRRKLEPDGVRPRYILTEPGVGYRLHVDRPAVLSAQT